MLCPTCNLNWQWTPVVKCNGSNNFRCVGCKAVYSGEMLAANSMLEALETACSNAEYLAHWDKPPQSSWYYKAKDAITQATGA